MTALRGWVDRRAEYEGRSVVDVVKEALSDPDFEEAARKELVRLAIASVPVAEQRALRSEFPEDLLPPEGTLRRRP